MSAPASRGGAPGSRRTKEQVADGEVRDAEGHSVPTRSSTEDADAPSTSSRAASIAWVKGIHCDTVCIQSGKSESGTFAPVKIRRKPNRTFDSTAASRTRSARAALISPSPVQEKAATTMTRASAGIDSAGDLDAEDQRADEEREGGDEGAVQDNRDCAAEEERETGSRADEDRPERVLVASPRRRGTSSRTSRGRPRTGSRFPRRRTRRRQGRPTARCTPSTGSGRSARRRGSGCRSSASASRRARGSS